jgi:hypothetical protein
MTEADAPAQTRADAAKPAAKPKPKQRYTSSDARRLYMKNLMRERRAAAKAAQTASTPSQANMAGQGEGRQRAAWGRTDRCGDNLPSAEAEVTPRAS